MGGSTQQLELQRQGTKWPRGRRCWRRPRCHPPTLTPTPHPNPRLFPSGVLPAKCLSCTKHRGLPDSAEELGLFRSPWPQWRPRAVICGSSGMGTRSGLIRDPAHPWAGPSPRATRDGQARAPTCVPHANIWRGEGTVLLQSVS